MNRSVYKLLYAVLIKKEEKVANPKWYKKLFGEMGIEREAYLFTKNTEK
jgi:hypothetical protein